MREGRKARGEPDPHGRSTIEHFDEVVLVYTESVACADGLRLDASAEVEVGETLHHHRAGKAKVDQRAERYRET